MGGSLVLKLAPRAWHLSLSLLVLYSFPCWYKWVRTRVKGWASWGRGWRVQWFWFRPLVHHPHTETQCIFMAWSWYGLSGWLARGNSEAQITIAGLMPFRCINFIKVPSFWSINFFLNYLQFILIRNCSLDILMAHFIIHQLRLYSHADSATPQPHYCAPNWTQKVPQRLDRSQVQTGTSTRRHPMWFRPLSWTLQRQVHLQARLPFQWHHLFHRHSYPHPQHRHYLQLRTAPKHDHLTVIHIKTQIIQPNHKRAVKPIKKTPQP